MSSHDPLGLTVEQRRVSDFSEQYGTMFGPMLAEPWREAYLETRPPLACPHCRCIVGHTPTCVDNLVRQVVEGEWFEGRA